MPTLHITVTDTQRQAAFAAMGWTGWTLEAAMADAIRSRIVEARARAIATRERSTAQGQPKPNGAA